MVELLLDHGADPNAHVDSSGNATWAAKTPELRQLLFARGGKLDCYDLVWLDEDDEVVRRVTADPSEANAGCGGVFTAAATRGKRDLVVRLLQAGARVPPLAAGCRSYLLEDPEILRLLLAGGMDPDMPDWQRATPLHVLCGRDARGRARAIIAPSARPSCSTPGATISARDEEYRSTPLAWAARNNLPDMVEFLLARGAPTNLPTTSPGPRRWPGPEARPRADRGAAARGGSVNARPKAGAGGRGGEGWKGSLRAGPRGCLPSPRLRGEGKGKGSPPCPGRPPLTLTLSPRQTAGRGQTVRWRQRSTFFRSALGLGIAWASGVGFGFALGSLRAGPRGCLPSPRLRGEGKGEGSPLGHGRPGRQRSTFFRTGPPQTSAAKRRRAARPRSVAETCWDRRRQPRRNSFTASWWARAAMAWLSRWAVGKDAST